MSAYASRNTVEYARVETYANQSFIPAVLRPASDRTPRTAATSWPPSSRSGGQCIVTSEYFVGAVHKVDVHCAGVAQLICEHSSERFDALKSLIVEVGGARMLHRFVQFVLRKTPSLKPFNIDECEFPYMICIPDRFGCHAAVSGKSLDKEPRLNYKPWDRNKRLDQKTTMRPESAKTKISWLRT